MKPNNTYTDFSKMTQFLPNSLYEELSSKTPVADKVYKIKQDIVDQISDKIQKSHKIQIDETKHTYFLDLQKYIDNLSDEQKAKIDIDYILNFKFETPLYKRFVDSFTSGPYTQDAIVTSISSAPDHFYIDGNRKFSGFHVFMIDSTTNPPDRFSIDADDLSITDLISLYTLVNILLSI